MPLSLNYYYGNEAEQYSFYRIPKVLFTDTRYRGLSVEAKVLYGLLLDRMALSVKNGWSDNDGKVFIYFTLEDALALLGCGKDKAIKLFKELDTQGGIGLIERKKQGQGRPTKIYVKNFTLSPDPGLTSEKPESALLDSIEVCTAEKAKSGQWKNRSLDCGKSAPNKTDKNDTDSNDTDLSINLGQPETPLGHPSSAQRRTEKIDLIDSYRELIKKNISYHLLLQDYPYDQERIDGFVELMTETVCSGRRTIRINQEDMPADIVKSRLLKLNGEHIRYIMDCLDRNTTLVGNIRAYTLSALFNAPVTISQYYASLASHDMAQGFDGG